MVGCFFIHIHKGDGGSVGTEKGSGGVSYLFVEAIGSS